MSQPVEVAGNGLKKCCMKWLWGSRTPQKAPWGNYENTLSKWLSSLLLLGLRSPISLPLGAGQITLTLAWKTLG